MLLTYEQDSNGATDSGLGDVATLAGLASWLMPTQIGMVTQEAAAAVGAGSSIMSSSSSHGSSDSYSVLILFDREHRFVHWAGTMNGEKIWSSSIGGIPHIIPNKKPLEVLPWANADGKAHLGAVGSLLSEVSGSAARAELDAGDISGFYLVHVPPGSPADSAGLRAGDIIYMMDGTLIVSREDLARVMNRVRLGDTIWLSILKVNDQGTRWTPRDIKLSFLMSGHRQ